MNGPACVSSGVRRIRPTSVRADTGGEPVTHQGGVIGRTEHVYFSRLRRANDRTMAGLEADEGFEGLFAHSLNGNSADDNPVTVRQDAIAGSASVRNITG